MLPGQIVQVCAPAALREPGASKGQHPFEHRREMLFLGEGKGAEGHGPGHVRGALKVLAAAVHQEKALLP